VKLTVKSSLLIVNGNPDMMVKTILDFKTGEALFGIMLVTSLFKFLIFTLSDWTTATVLIVIVKSTSLLRALKPNGLV
jgi:hypothetical protein